MEEDLVYVATNKESSEASRRIYKDATSRLAFGPGQAFVVGCSAVLSISSFEGYLHLNGTTPFSLQKAKFVFRYGLANLIPSVIWGGVPAVSIIDALNMDPKILRQDLSASRFTWRRTRIQSYRGAIAGSMLLSQLLSLVQVVTEAKEAYSRRLYQGREPPLLEDSSIKNVVVRLAGGVSDATTLGMQRDGRGKYFPIFEDSDVLEVQQLVRQFGLNVGTYGVPVFWQVSDGHYGHEDSWRDLKLPSQWLFDKKVNGNRTSTSTTNSGEKDKLLILEADATVGESMTASLTYPKDMDELDLNLYEVAQGFFRLKQLVSENAPPYDVLRVLLVDAHAIVRSGGGSTRSVRDYVSSLGLADVIIDARNPLIYSIQNWLSLRSKSDSYHHVVKPSFPFWPTGKPIMKPVILETPSEPCFRAIQSALEVFGYSIMNMDTALKEYGDIVGIPILVYARTTQDTIHTIQRLIQRQEMVLAENVCALCPTHYGLVEMKSGQESPVATICSSDVYDHLYRQVRKMAQDGHTSKEIQYQLDNHVDKILESRQRLGFPPLQSF